MISESKCIHSNMFFLFKTSCLLKLYVLYDDNIFFYLDKFIVFLSHHYSVRTGFHGVYLVLVVVKNA